MALEKLEELCIPEKIDPAIRQNRPTSLDAGTPVEIFVYQKKDGITSPTSLGFWELSGSTTVINRSQKAPDGSPSDVLLEIHESDLTPATIPTEPKELAEYQKSLAGLAQMRLANMARDNRNFANILVGRDITTTLDSTTGVSYPDVVSLGYGIMTEVHQESPQPHERESGYYPLPMAERLQGLFSSKLLKLQKSLIWTRNALPGSTQPINLVDTSIAHHIGRAESRNIPLGVKDNLYHEVQVSMEEDERDNVVRISNLHYELHEEDNSDIKPTFYHEIRILKERDDHYYHEIQFGKNVRPERRELFVMPIEKDDIKRDKTGYLLGSKQRTSASHARYIVNNDGSVGGVQLGSLVDRPNTQQRFFVPLIDKPGEKGQPIFVSEEHGVVQQIEAIIRENTDKFGYKDESLESLIPDKKNNSSSL